MWHNCVFSQQMHGLALFRMTCRVFHACRIPDECVHVTFLLISSSLRPLHPVHFKIFLAQIFYQEVHRLAFSYVTPLRFQSTDAWCRPLLNEFRMFHACRIPDECVHVTFLLISSSLRPLHPVHFEIFLEQIFYQEVYSLAFRYVTQLPFQSTDAWSCPLSNYIPGVSRV